MGLSAEHTGSVRSFTGTAFVNDPVDYVATFSRQQIDAGRMSDLNKPFYFQPNPHLLVGGLVSRFPISCHYDRL